MDIVGSTAMPSSRSAVRRPRPPRRVLAGAAATALAAAAALAGLPAAVAAPAGSPPLVVAFSPNYAVAATAQLHGALVVAGRTTSGGVELAHWNAAGGWNTVTALPGLTTGKAPAVILDPHTGGLDVFGVTSDGGLVWDRQLKPGAAYTGWQAVGGPKVAGRPAVAADAALSSVLVAVTTSRGQVSLGTETGGTFAWRQLGGFPGSGLGPAVTTTGPDTALLALTQSNDVVKVAETRVAAAGSAQPSGRPSWTYSGVVSTDPPAAATVAGTPWLYVTRTGSHTVEASPMPGASRSNAWRSLGGSIGGAPGVATGGTTPGGAGRDRNRQDVFAMGLNGDLYQRTAVGSAWQAWQAVSQPPATTGSGGGNGRVTSPPPWTSSHYTTDMTGTPSTDSAKGYEHGCARGKQHNPGLVILDYGAQVRSGGVWGTYKVLAYGDFLSDTDIVAHAEGFISGYVACSPHHRPAALVLSLGTNNSGSTRYEGLGGGQIWAEHVVDAVSAWATANGYSKLHVHVAGADDLEPGFGPAKTARNWVRGFSTSTDLRYYNFGSADGCPGIGYSGTACGDGWNLGDVWRVSAGYAHSRTVPEIFTPAGSGLTQGSQWANISLWGVDNGHPRIEYAGEITQHQACQQVGGCQGTDNSPRQGWRELWRDVSAQRQTRIASLPFSTDITYDG
jgi:hypothetical protein